MEKKKNFLFEKNLKKKKMLTDWMIVYPSRNKTKFINDKTFLKRLTVHLFFSEFINNSIITVIISLLLF